ncbi:tRNA-specific 2-thiouridylase mnmA [Nitzschia inconspicua]|uniref:tRNA-specific 2-thiouridylase mnmA n=1 Tax=Nitzschia inconspicua TaxID=303405 RepID=A0A9K3Q0H3_9STRA|nr:tRNA-specific 2-thiouridylase mnmA [Nitzschia inconspicua]
MSGGVDSSVVAYLLSQKFNPSKNILMGIHMTNWDYHDEATAAVETTKNDNPSKCWEQDWKDAQAVAKHLQIPLHHVSFQKEYWNDVFEPYCNQVAHNVTPNPDVDCNRWIKFGVLKDYLSKRYGIDRLATGHYARLWDRSIGQDMPHCLQECDMNDPILEEYLMQSSVQHLPILLAAKDRSKDQSYFLSNVPTTAFSNVLFPLGDYYKKRMNDDRATSSSSSTADERTVRELAQQAQLPNATKRDSMGICFVGKRKHGVFLNQYIAPSQNNHNAKLRCINIEDGSVVATVDSNPSLLYATIGQGAKIPGASHKWFVVEKVVISNDKHPTLLLCSGTHHPALYSETLFICRDKLHWMMGGVPPPLPFRAKCRIRHLQPLVDCVIDLYHDQKDKNKDYYVVRLESPLRGIAEGQVCAIYAGGSDGDLICLGGGPINHRGPSYWDLQKELPPLLHPAGQNDLSYTGTM